MAMFDLPQELIDMIFDQITARTDLKTLTLVSRNFVLPGQCRLFRSLTLEMHRQPVMAAGSFYNGVRVQGIKDRHNLTPFPSAMHSLALGRCGDVPAAVLFHAHQLLQRSNFGGSGNQYGGSRDRIPDIMRI
ncbi:hypothetical protein MSAN_00137300 [Mycena sanguinolenta]|uniref:F-box domain-containing protein n=1 Tax=Mycena sanguinolenta TaxID=230812 RepID=A0A8H6ZH05_9AGAR|nr:hypothetical protein MSAN_00137300 [Mycena sanguinolenta]